MNHYFIYSNLNPAVIKALLRRSSQSEIKQHAQSFKEIALELPIGSERSMYIGLYQYCRVCYYENFLHKKGAH